MVYSLIWYTSICLSHFKSEGENVLKRVKWNKMEHGKISRMLFRLARCAENL